MAYMFILASGSPRRKELLQQIGARFEVLVSEAEEITGDGIAPEELVARNAAAKAQAVAQEHPEMAVLGADTVVSFKGHTYGKPDSEAGAAAMLRELSGNCHKVSTGIAWVKDGQTLTATVTTQVEFDELTDMEIRAYIATGEPLDKAGAYAIQGRAAAFIKAIKGSFSNVVGLPLNATIRLAEKAGVDLYGNHGERFTDN